MKISRSVSVGLGLLMSFSVLPSWPSWGAPFQSPAQEEAGTAADVARACRKECPDATNNREAFRCIETLEKNHGGEHGLKAKDRVCFEAHERYERTMKQDKDKASRDSQSEPYRYG